MSANDADMGRVDIALVSRCSRTIHNFRRPVIRAAEGVGYRVTALGAGGDGYDAMLIDEGVDFRPVGISLRGIDLIADIRLFFQFRAIFRRLAPSIVHAFTIKPAIYATLAAWSAGVPARIVTITGLGHAFTTGNGLLRMLVEALYRIALHRADLVFFQNSSDRDLFLARRLVSRDRVRMVAGSGVNLEVFSPAPLPVLEGRPPCFLMIARLLKDKGIAEYVSAATAIRKKYPEVEFRLLGGVDPRNPSSLGKEEFDGMNRAGAVTWLGETSDVREHIADADVVVLPSYREGLPRSLLEGAAMGRALLATDVPGCRDVVEDGVTGYLVPAGDADSLAGRMQDLIISPDRIAAMGSKARQSVELHYDEAQVIKTTLDAYRSLLSEKVQP